jgi:hypothetical protein
VAASINELNAPPEASDLGILDRDVIACKMESFAVLGAIAL